MELWELVQELQAVEPAAVAWAQGIFPVKDVAVAVCAAAVSAKGTEIPDALRQRLGKCRKQFQTTCKKDH